MGGKFRIKFFMGHPHAVIMTHAKKIQGKFYPLQHEELIELNKRLTASELAVYLWLKTNEPFGDKLVEADTKTIAIDLNISRRSVQRALVKLRQEKLIDLVITKFHYRVRSKSAESPPNTKEDSDNTNENSNNTSEVKERLRVATSVSPDDISVANGTPMSPSVRECRQRYANVANGTPMSSPSAETKSEQSVQNPKTLQTYSDFKRSLSESERENFFNYVKEKTKNLRQPINDLEAWLASKNAANQNRWSAYYNLYQTEELKRQAINKEHNSSTKRLTLEQERQAIAEWQEYLKQQKLAVEKLQEKSRLEKQQSQTEPRTEQNNSNHHQTTSEPPENTQHPTRSEFNQMLNNPQGATKNTSPSVSGQSKTNPSSNRKINRNQARKILRDLDLRQQLENSQNPDLGGES